MQSRQELDNLYTQDAVSFTKRVLELRLKSEFPRIKTAYEGVNFTAPSDELYFVVKHLPSRTEDPTLGSLYYREHIELQVFVVDVLGKGTGNALGMASKVRALFDKGFSYQANGFKLNVFRTPQIAGASITSERVVVPVFVTAVTEVYKTEQYN